MSSPSPIGCFPLLTSPPPALTLPGGLGGEGRPQATKGEGGKGSRLLPGAVGVKLLLPQNPQFLVLQLLTEGELSAHSHGLSQDSSPSPPLLSLHRGTMREIKDGGGRNEGTSLFPTLSWGTPAHQRLSARGPLSWLPVLSPGAFSDPCPLSATHSVFPQPLPGSCLHGHLCPEASPFPAPSSLSGLSPFLYVALLQGSLLSSPRHAQQREGQRNSIKEPGLTPKAWFCHGVATLGHPGLPSE